MINPREHIIVKFKDDKCKNHWKRSDAKRHAWNKQYYYAVGFESYSETGEGFVLLVNDLGEIWWVCNRDLVCDNAEELSSDQ